MMMEFKFNEQKLKQNGLSAEMCFRTIDRFLNARGIYAKETGVYVADDSQNSFDSFGSAMSRLPKSNWFLKVIDEWYWFDDENDRDYNDDEYNCLKYKFWHKDGTYEYKEIPTF